jgi:hypothetical protein
MRTGCLNAGTISTIADRGATDLLAGLEAAGELGQMQEIVSLLIATGLGMALGAAAAGRIMAEQQAGDSVVT